MLDPCQCYDPQCPAHPGVEPCGQPSTVTVYRVDMVDTYGAPFCEACAGDAMESGLYTIPDDDDDDMDIDESEMDGYHAEAQDRT